MIDYIIQNGWMPWLISITLLYPLSIVLIGEIIFRIRHKYPQFASILRIMQFVIIPSFIIMKMMTTIIGLSGSNVFVKIFSTIFWISVIISTVAAFNVLMLLKNSKTAKVPKLLIDLARLFLIILGIAFVVSHIWGVDLTKLLTALGVGSVVLGLALQDTLSGVFSGFALLSGNQFNIGDWLKVGDTEGQIEGMDWRSVTLLTRENDYVVIPNTMLAKDRFINFSRPNPIHMERVTFDISFDDAPHKVKDILLSVANQTDGILKEPAPIVALLSYDEFSVKYEIQYFINDYSRQPVIRDKFISAVWYAASRDGFVFPTRSHEVYHFEGNKPGENGDIGAILEKLRTLPLKLSEEEYKNVAKNAKLYNYGKGEEILRQGEYTKLLYFITKGSVEEVFIDNKEKKHPIAALEEGQFFGMRTLTGTQPNKTSFYAKSDTEVITLNLNAIKIILQAYPHFAQTIETVFENRDEMLEKVKKLVHN